MHIGMSMRIGSGNSGFNPTRLLAGSTAIFSILPGTPYGVGYTETTGASATTVSGNGDAVGTWKCNLSGRFATSSSGPNSPLLEVAGGFTSINFDGITQFLSTPVAIATGVSKAQIFCAVRKNSDATQAALIEFSGAPTVTAGAVGLNAPGDAGQPRYSVGSNLGSTEFAGVASFAAPTTNVVCLLVDGTKTTVDELYTFQVDGVTRTLINKSADPVTPGVFGTHALFFGRRNASTLPFNGKIYGAIVRFSADNLSAGLVSQTSKWLGTRCGVSF
jgi:hypothetical protein